MSNDSPTRTIVRCAECRKAISPQEWEDHGHLCDGCEMAHYQEAHQQLYGREECLDCGAVLMHEDEQQSNRCRRCDGVEVLYDADEDQEGEGE